MDETNPKNAYISPPEVVASGVVVRMLLEDHVPNIQMVLVIDENTNFDAISQNRKDIKLLFKLLENENGTNLNKRQRTITYGLLQWHEEGMGWERLTMMLNYLCIVFTISDFEKKKQKVNRVNLVINSELQIGTTSGSAALLYIFSAFGKTVYEATDNLKEWMQQGLEFLTEDRLPIDISSEPFRSAIVRDKVRYLQSNIEKGKITISEEDYGLNSLEFDIYIMHLNDCFNTANRLLEKKGSEVWKRNKNKILRKVNEIIEKWESSDDPEIIIWRDLLKNREKT